MQPVICRSLGINDYETMLVSMQEFTNKRDLRTLDEIWFLEHYPVCTIGKAGLEKYILDFEKLVKNNIPIIKSDRGGQITYHGPGQLIIYFLINLIRKPLTVKQLINHVTYSIIDFLKVEYNLDAKFYKKFPGIYINGSKICSIGLKITKGCSYHGISFNVDLDLTPFSWIVPCGISGLNVVRLKDLIIDCKFLYKFTNNNNLNNLNFSNMNNMKQYDINLNQIITLLKAYLLKNLEYIEV